LSFFLIHTGVKLATHHHLQDTALPDQIDYLSNLVDMAKNAFEQHDSRQLITCINHYHAKLAELGLVAEHSLQLINQLKDHPEVLAIKGCGALGADIILILTSRSAAPTFNKKLQQENRSLLATENLLNFNLPLLAISKN
jgi:mevalonate kinase